MICSYFSCFYVLSSFDKNSFTAKVLSIAHHSSVNLFVHTSVQFGGLITCSELSACAVLYCSSVIL